MANENNLVAKSGSTVTKELMRLWPTVYNNPSNKYLHVWLI